MAVIKVLTFTTELFKQPYIKAQEILIPRLDIMNYLDPASNPGSKPQREIE